MASVAEADCFPTPKPSRTALEANKPANELQHAWAAFQIWYLKMISVYYHSLKRMSLL